MDTVSLIYATAPSHAIAESIGRALVHERLAACVNVLGSVRAIYRWEGVMEETDEAAFLVKTTARHGETVISRIKDLHPHACPAILSIPVNGGFAPFLAWVKAETSD